MPLSSGLRRPQSSQEDPSSMAPADLFPPKSHQEERELWLGVTPVGTPRLQQLHTHPGLCNCWGRSGLGAREAQLLILPPTDTLHGRGKVTEPP